MPLPRAEQQAAIVARHEVEEQELSHLERQLRLLDQRTSRLGSSILAAAFSGSLVPQGPRDESASVLLERITAERLLSNGYRATRGRKRVTRVEATG